jgi:hypothetical protein
MNESKKELNIEISKYKNLCSDVEKEFGGYKKMSNHNSIVFDINLDEVKHKILGIIKDSFIESIDKDYYYDLLVDASGDDAIYIAKNYLFTIS